MLKVERFGVHNFDLPKRQTEGSAGYDLISTEDVVIVPSTHCMIPTGFSWQIPRGWCGQIWARSGIALRKQVAVLGGLIDEDYCGEVKVILQNNGRKNFVISKGDRIAQMNIVPYFSDSVFESKIENSGRSSSGFGSTGK